jgi:hypothetical protein
MNRIVGWTVVLALLLPGAAGAVDTVSCDGKRSWQRDIVKDAVRNWVAGHPDSDSLINLVQAEHGIVACAAGGRPPHLHTTTLPRGLALDQFGAVLLANELEWRGLIPAPEDGLAGRFFRVETRLEPEIDPYEDAAP